MSFAVDDLADPQDREFVATVDDPGRQAVIVASLLRHRVEEKLAPGDPMPAVAVTRLEPPGTVRLDELSGERPVVLVFGSYT